MEKSRNKRGEGWVWRLERLLPTTNKFERFGFGPSPPPSLPPLSPLLDRSDSFVFVIFCFFFLGLSLGGGRVTSPNPNSSARHPQKIWITSTNNHMKVWTHENLDHTQQTHTTQQHTQTQHTQHTHHTTQHNTRKNWTGQTRWPLPFCRPTPMMFSCCIGWVRSWRGPQVMIEAIRVGG